MTGRTTSAVVGAVVGCSGAAALALGWVLPALAALEPGEGVVGCWAAAVGGGLATLARLILAARRARAAATALSDLPGQLATTFALGTLALLGLAALLGLDRVAPLRPWASLVGAPALVVATALALRALVHRPLLTEVWLRATASGASTPRGLGVPGLGVPGLGVPVLAVRPTLVVAALALAAVICSVLGVHLHCRARADAERLAGRRVVELSRLAEAVGRRLGPAGLERWVARQAAGSPERLVLAGGRVTVEPRGGPAGADPGQGAVGLLLLLMSIVVLGGVTALAWVYGGDVRADLRTISDQLREMASVDDEQRLGRPLAVASVDEVGELAAAVGRLRRVLQRELEAFFAARRSCEEIDERKARFLADVSHELRTPLTNISASCEALAGGRHGELTAPQREDLAVVRRGARQLLALINDVLDISAIDAGQLVLQRRLVELGALAREAVEGQRGALEAQRGGRVRLVCEVEPELPPIEADPARVRRVLTNLLSNALKFTEQGEIAVRVGRAVDGGALVCEVSDTGCGIGANELPRIFEEYQQAGGLAARRQGSGLGLAICRRLVELHGGRISVESEVGRGSRFVVRWPVGRGEAEGEEAGA